MRTPEKRVSGELFCKLPRSGKGFVNSRFARANPLNDRNSGSFDSVEPSGKYGVAPRALTRYNFYPCLPGILHKHQPFCSRPKNPESGSQGMLPVWSPLPKKELPPGCRREKFSWRKTGISGTALSISVSPRWSRSSSWSFFSPGSSGNAKVNLNIPVRETGTHTIKGKNHESRVYRSGSSRKGHCAASY